MKNQTEKIKITKKEIEDIYDIIEDNTIEVETIKEEEKSESEFLTEEEQLHDDHLSELLNWDDEK